MASGPQDDDFAHQWWDDLSGAELARRLEQRDWEARIARWAADHRDTSVQARRAIAKALAS